MGAWFAFAGVSAALIGVVPIEAASPQPQLVRRDITLAGNDSCLAENAFDRRRIIFVYSSDGEGKPCLMPSIVKNGSIVDYAYKDWQNVFSVSLEGVQSSLNNFEFVIEDILTSGKDGCGVI
ncbi:hypothetical protein [Methylobacterium sp. WL120]|uniref:hypothetical protein n=1 Tax=Methylobacterium sp. WL120 TaxID=2603887 RepID=UPI0011C763AE|nr:hypothetical protein [Methylobacterium sp. WL120]TXM70413.1 hypothetical protein FV229_02360 [Methylobacterium sp. WL120]